MRARTLTLLARASSSLACAAAALVEYPETDPSRRSLLIDNSHRNGPLATLGRCVTADDVDSLPQCCPETCAVS